MTVIASGDSMTVGVGEKDFKINPGSWVKYYCQMTGKKMVPIAKNGTTTSSYIKTQLPYIISQRPEHVFISIGGNDVLRSSFSPSNIFVNICQIGIALKSLGIRVIIIDIIDISKVPTATKIAKKIMSERCNQANRAIKLACKTVSIDLIEISKDEKLYDNNNFHIDGIHFNSRGYMYIALKVMEYTKEKPIEDIIFMEKKWTIPEKILWLATHATPWIFRRMFDLIPGLVFLYVKDLFERKIKLKQYW